MADTAVANLALSREGNANVKEGQGTVIVAANTHVITPTGPLEEMLILVNNTTAGAATVTVLKGANPPADAKDQGDLVVTVATTSGYSVIGPLESARFLQANGTIRINVSAGVTGFILPIQIPRV